MHYRSYRGGDEAPLVTCWNRSLPRDQVHLGRFVQTTLLDDNFAEEGLIEAWDDQDELRGFVNAVSVRDGTKGAPGGAEGWLQALVVDPATRRQGVGSELLRRAELYLAGRGCASVAVTPYPPAYYYPGVPLDRYAGSEKLFEGAGYRRTATVDAMDLLLAAYEVPSGIAQQKTRLEADGWEFGCASVQWYTRLIQLCEKFSEDWAGVVRSALRRGMSPEQVQLATRHGQVAGFTIFGAFDGCPDRFGPFGVADEFRRIGLGAVLLHETLREMASRNMHCAWFLWTGEHDAAWRLYDRASFEVTRRFGIYEKQLGQPGTDRTTPPRGASQA